MGNVSKMYLKWCGVLKNQELLTLLMEEGCDHIASCVGEHVKKNSVVYQVIEELKIKKEILDKLLIVI